MAPTYASGLSRGVGSPVASVAVSDDDHRRSDKKILDLTGATDMSPADASTNDEDTLSRMLRLTIRAVLVLVIATAISWWMLVAWGAYGFAALLMLAAFVTSLYPLVREESRRSRNR